MLIIVYYIQIRLWGGGGKCFFEFEGGYTVDVFLRKFFFLSFFNGMVMLS